MLSLIIPAYNEAENIERVLDVVVRMPDFQQIIVVDDGSVDDTYATIKKYPVETIRFDRNRGKGAAILSGRDVRSSSLFDVARCRFCSTDVDV